MTPAPNKMEGFNRERKCIALARWLARQFLGTVEGLNDIEWQMAAHKAGVNMPSEQSQKRVLEILRGKLDA